MYTKTDDSVRRMGFGRWLQRTSWIAVIATASACGGDSGGGAPSPAPDGGEPLDGALDAARDAGLDGAPDGGGDASPPDASDDAGASDDASMDGDAATMTDTPPLHLRDTGLYADGSLGTLAEGVLAYAPRYELWSDGADKQRYLLVPDGEVIDTIDLDGFVFPVGTKAWKEFSQGGVRLETRLLWKTDGGWVHVAYAWNEAQDDAVATTRGAADVLGTEHDIPTRVECRECHNGAADTLLGVSALQLAHAGPGLTLAQLEAQGRLSDPPPADLARPDELAWNALGYLHANCGTCHNPRGTGFQRVDLDLGLRAGERAVTSTRAYATSVGVAVEQTSGDDTARIAPGAPQDSALITRMKLRGAEEAMPPIASERIDDAGVALIEAWIETL